MTLHADWKSAEEVAAEIAADEAALSRIVVDLWERVEALEREMARLRQGPVRSDPW